MFQPVAIIVYLDKKHLQFWNLNNKAFVENPEGNMCLGKGGAQPEVDMWEGLKFFTNSKHCFLHLPAPGPRH